jgi:hypothetical protein
VAGIATEGAAALAGSSAGSGFEREVRTTTTPTAATSTTKINRREFMRELPY